jgi:hypothetical protein
MQASVVGQLTASRPPVTVVQTPDRKSTPPVVAQSEVGQLIAPAWTLAVTAQLVPSVVDKPSPKGPTATHTVVDEQLMPVAYLLDAKVKVDHVVPLSVVLKILPVFPAR